MHPNPRRMVMKKTAPLKPPTDEEIIQHNVDYVLANRTRLYAHQGEKLDAVAMIEVGISDRMQTIKEHGSFYGRHPTEWSRSVVAQSQHDVDLMEEALRRLRALGVTTDSPLARQLRWERENPLPTAGELLAPAAKLYRAGKHWKRVGVLLDMEKGVSGVDSGKVRRKFKKIADLAELGEGAANPLPEVQAIMQAEFAGALINKQNLSDWRATGLVKWETRQEVLTEILDFDGDAGELDTATSGRLAESEKAFVVATCARRKANPHFGGGK